ncbi:phosphatase PAP2 family protein [Candidatus Nomurabacteria bacterium]|nr:phosphatase PAP2 family protein [Candidatus Nomurabacteria bacterium]
MSWSKNLFLKINSQLGQKPMLDAFYIFWARFGIVLLALLSLGASYLVLGGLFWGYWLGLMSKVFIIALLASYLIAVFWRQPRPIKELEGVRQMIPTLGSWRTFPSEHALFSFIFALHLFFFVAHLGVVLSLLSILMILMAILISIGRVWAGVHYPKDILGGLLLAVAVLAIFLYV